MASVKEHLNKMREERLARENARLQKLRELNLKKYNKTEPLQVPKSASTVSFLKKPSNASSAKNNSNTNNTIKRPMSMMVHKSTAKPANAKDDIKNIIAKPTTSNVSNKADIKPPNAGKFVKNDHKITENAKKTLENGAKHTEKIPVTDKRKSIVDYSFKRPNMIAKTDPNGLPLNKPDNNLERAKNKPRPSSARQSFIPKIEQPKSSNIKPKPFDSRKSIIPTKTTQNSTSSNSKRQSVFERLYQPKTVQKNNITDAEKIKNDPNFFKKIMKNTGLILNNKRKTMFETKRTIKEPTVRRSISAVHFKRIGTSELGNCIHKWSSIGDKLDKVHLKDINEDATVKEDKIVSAVKSERKKVKFQTPIYNFNTPKPDELQSRLKNWLEKRGKSLSSYHHLQCFGIHHLAEKEIKPLNLEAPEPTKFEVFDDEDKENKPVESDSDNESYDDVMNHKQESVTDKEQANELSKLKEDECCQDASKDRWRRASYVSDCVTDLNETQNSTLTSIETTPVGEVLLGALSDLTELLREGFDWEQCARWLRAIRERFPTAHTTAAYWECRAALEERRGDLPASVQCWEEAIAKGTECSVVEANLDQLLDKFMQLRISPGSGKRQQPNPKLVDVKNVFKSTLIRFAVQQAKIRQSQEPTCVVTPVRRSGRLSVHWSVRRTPLQECTTVKQAGLLAQKPVLFVPNDKLGGTP